MGLQVALTMLGGAAHMPSATDVEEGKEVGERGHSGWPDGVPVNRNLVSAPVRKRL